MAHFAKLNDENIVEQVIVVNNEVLLNDEGIEVEKKGADFCADLFGGRWVQTSYNNSFRGLYAGIGYRYDSKKKLFIAPEVVNVTNEL